MTGQIERSWSWLHSVVVPAALALAEAAWLWAFLASVARVGPSERADVPFLAVALPALAAVAISALLGRPRWRAWRRDVAGGGAALLGACLTAGTLGALYLHGGFIGFAFEPVAVSGRLAGAGATIAWFVAALSWGRGTWLGWREPDVRAVVRSVLLSGAAFVCYFLVAAVRHRQPGFRAEAVPAAALFVLACPAAVAALGLANERDLERWRARNAKARPSLSWFLAVFVPMSLVAGFGLLLAVAVGPLGRLVVRGLGDAAVWIGRLLLALLRRIGNLFPAGTGQAPAQRRPRPPLAPLPQLHPAHVAGWLVDLGEALGALVTLALLVLIGRLVLALVRRLRLRRPGAGQEPPAGEERDSLFSWHHLLAQLLGVVRRRLGLRRARRLAGALGALGALATEGEGGGVEVRTVREHYRRFLVAARRAGAGRAASETPLELEARLLAGGLPAALAPSAGPPLGAAAAGGAAPGWAALERLPALTALYDDARYGGLGGAGEANSAAGHVDVLVAALGATGAPAARPGGSADPEHLGA